MIGVTILKQFNNYKNVYRYLDYYCDINLKDNSKISKYNAISNLYQYFEEYLNIINIQFERLQINRDELSMLANCSITEFEDELKFTKLFADIHFLLIAIEKSYNIAIKLYGYLDLQSKSLKIKQSMDYLSKKRIRNSIEHMDENIIKPSTIDHQNWFISDFYTLRENTYKLGDYELELSENNLSILYSYYSEITSILIKEYVEPVKETVDRIWQSIETDIKKS